MSPTAHALIQFESDAAGGLSLLVNWSITSRQAAATVAYEIGGRHTLRREKKKKSAKVKKGRR